MKKEFDRLKFNYNKNRKFKNTIQIGKLNNYIAGSRAVEIFCSEIIRMTNNPFMKDDPEAILLNLKDFCEKRIRFCVEEKNIAHTELTALKKLQQLSNQEPQLEEDIFEPIME